MKLIETQQSKVDKGTTVYVFKLGKSEVLLLQDVLHYLKKVVPKSFFTMPFTSRANAMRNELDKIVSEYKLQDGRKRKKGWDPLNPNDIF